MLAAGCLCRMDDIQVDVGFGDTGTFWPTLSAPGLARSASALSRGRWGGPPRPPGFREIHRVEQSSPSHLGCGLVPGPAPAPASGHVQKVAAEQ